ncbi:hypothetical protein [Chitinophaga sp. XS-30]|uniref:hypothetical protein n=1 Tax=Chitinophaga sp. XS-30 TaxID=2604421 RepID=UPI0011DE100D|nr:hypothetical protein [Chitinophaga sp. XS-30]QEH40658.1 hypothetical protein FW415_07135 [Chitinophaga sp. XS-30]
MSNFTLPFSTANCTVTNPEGKTTMNMKEHMELAREEHQQHLFTLQALDKVQYTPRTSTLIAIFDYAQSEKEER